MKNLFLIVATLALSACSLFEQTAEVVVEKPRPAAKAEPSPPVGTDSTPQAPKNDTGAAKPSFDKECVQNIKSTIVAACFGECARGEAKGFNTSPESIEACRQKCLAGGAALADRECGSR